MKEIRTITIDAHTPWVMRGEWSEPLERALQDIQRDWYLVLGRNPHVLPPHSASLPEGDLTIYMGMAGSWLEDFDFAEPRGRETFQMGDAVTRSGQHVFIVTGADVRGTIYALYALSEHILGVNPWWFWTDLEAPRKKRIKLDTGFGIDSGSPAFRWRGWFMNDEDLLNGFAPDPLRENVFSLEMYDRIYETILRLRGNMVTPATFPFPDERCHELAARRGLAINSHHVLPLGLNTYRWPKDWTYSFTEEPELLEKCWRASARALCDKEVVWTIGLRGKYDHPIWFDDRTLTGEEAAGKIIGDAMSSQVSIIRELQPKAEIIANLWEEGAELYSKGLLVLPDGVIAVWPDSGNGILRDGGQIAEGDGIYYHTAMFSVWQNQLTEMVSPSRIFRETARCLDAGANSFFLINVSDIRPVPLSTGCAMKIAWDGKPCLDQNGGASAWLESWCREQFGTAHAGQMADLYKAYFAAPAMQNETTTYGENFFPRWTSGFFYDVIQPALDEERESPWEVVVRRGNEPGLLRMKFAVFQEATLDSVEKLARTTADYFETLLQSARNINLPRNRRNFHRGHLVLQASLHFHLARAAGAFIRSIRQMAKGQDKEARESIEEAAGFYQQLLQDVQQAEYGRWRGWFRGDKTVRLEEFDDTIRAMRAVLHGQPVPVRKQWPILPYSEICRYQEAHLMHFPLFYPEPTASRH